jgi:hypothetical protein
LSKGYLGLNLATWNFFKILKFSLKFKISINNIVAPPLMSPSPFQLSSSRSSYHPYFYSHQVIALVTTSFHFVITLCRGFKSFITLSLWTMICTCIIVKICNVLRCLLLVSCDLEIGTMFEPLKLNLEPMGGLWWWINPCRKIWGLHWFQELMLEVIINGLRFKIGRWKLTIKIHNKEVNFFSFFPLKVCTLIIVVFIFPCVHALCIMHV